MTLNQQRQAWLTVGLWITILFLLLVIRGGHLHIAGMALAEEKPVPIPSLKRGKEAVKTSYDLPRDQVQEYRALEAEARAIRAEATLNIQSILKRQEELMRVWEKLVGGDLKGWELDQQAGKLKQRAKNEKAPEAEKDK